MTIQITHQSGVGNWAYGAVITLNDRRALALIHDGYAVAVKDELPRKSRGERHGRAVADHHARLE